MRSKKWKEFEKLTEQCYANMIEPEHSLECWNKAYGVLKEIITDGRNAQPEFAAELYLLDEDTDYEYDVQGWLEDYLDEVDMAEEQEELLEICDELLELFRWEEDSPSDIRFLRTSTLRALDRNEEAAEYCKQWLEKEPDNVYAVTASVYAEISVKNPEAAENLIKQYIPEGTECTEENDILFMAASAFYQMSRNEKEKARIDRAIEAYEEYMEEYLMNVEDDEEISFL